VGSAGFAGRRWLNSFCEYLAVWMPGERPAVCVSDESEEQSGKVPESQSFERIAGGSLQRGNCCPLS
ncbi:MAG: hypothetical protein ACKPJD_20525, partial [Planctomycetaceae bacterium]